MTATEAYVLTREAFRDRPSARIRTEVLGPGLLEVHVSERVAGLVCARSVVVALDAPFARSAIRMLRYAHGQQVAVVVLGRAVRRIMRRGEEVS